MRSDRADDRRGCVYRQIVGTRDFAWMLMCGASRAFVLSASTQSIVAGDGGDARGAHGFLTVGASGNRRGRAVAAQTQCGRARRTARTTLPARLLSHRSDTPTGARLPFECAARGMPIRLPRFTSARAKPFAKRLEASFGSSRVRRVTVQAVASPRGTMRPLSSVHWRWYRRDGGQARDEACDGIGMAAGTGGIVDFRLRGLCAMSVHRTTKRWIRRHLSRRYWGNTFMRKP
ncbi:hypothetical protein BSIN_2587 [Burkholderia singularis]|uniref:Uncharacterized protein n=1 Tax=Burkholderia singularis TaxID=1503053 RepID=A0A238H2W5_9BURK|nr:hypothetical protein BSIN_2587 [Burkholderia singularis]